MKRQCNGVMQCGSGTKFRSAVKQHKTNQVKRPLRCKAKLISRQFVLQREQETGRVFIGEELGLGCEALQATVAGCWLEAKNKFGFQLTETQKSLLTNIRRRSRHRKYRCQPQGRVKLSHLAA